MKFWIVEPTNRPSFRLVAFEHDQSGKRLTVSADDKRIAHIRDKFKKVNELYLRNAVSRSNARMMIEELVRSEERRTEGLKTKLRLTVMSEANHNLLEEFWEAKYAHKENKDLASARHDFVRALRAIEPLPLIPTKAKDLDQRLIKTCGRDTKKRKRVASKLNEILSYYGSKEKLVICRTPRDPVIHLTEKEIQTLANHAPEKVLRLGVLTLFATGCRIGEALDLGSGRIDKRRGTIYVQSQISLKSGKREEPKRGSEGEVFVIPKYWPVVMDWIKIKEKNRALYEHLYDFVTSQSRALWPDDESKHISIHDLRHSHAVHLLESGASLEIVARNLRNSIFTCQRYYTGYQHSMGTVEMLKSILTKK